MIDIAMLWRLAATELTRMVAQIRDGDWERPTPCEGWTVRDLVSHVVDENRWLPPLLAGHGLDEAAGELADLPEDLRAAASVTLERAALAVTFYGVAGQVHTSEGVIPTTELLWQMLTDQLIHTWDLAAALGHPDDLDPVLVELCAGWFAEQEAGWREAGVIGPAVPVPADAGAQTRLLAAFGRDRAAWTTARAPARAAS